MALHGPYIRNAEKGVKIAKILPKKYFQLSRLRLMGVFSHCRLVSAKKMLKYFFWLLKNPISPHFCPHMALHGPYIRNAEKGVKITKILPKKYFQLFRLRVMGVFSYCRLVSAKKNVKIFFLASKNPIFPLFLPPYGPPWPKHQKC